MLTTPLEALKAHLDGKPLTLIHGSSLSLRERSADVTDIATEVLPLLPALRELLKAKKGASIAPSQVGINLRFFVTRNEKFPVVIRPQILVWSLGRTSAAEGSITWPGRTTFVARPARITAEWIDEVGENKRATLEGFDARCFQHMTDMLDGRLIFR